MISEPLEDELRKANFTVIASRRFKNKKDEYTTLIKFETEESIPANTTIFLNGSKRIIRLFGQPNIVLRCLKCQKYGHHISKCKNEARCPRCARSDCDNSCFQDNSMRKCANCGGPHSATYGGCPVYKKESEEQIKKQKVKTYADATKKHLDKRIETTKTSVEAVKKSVSEIQQQTVPELGTAGDFSITFITRGNHLI